MRFLAAISLAAFAAAQSSTVDIPISDINPGGPIILAATSTTLTSVVCPTVTKTGTICSTCAIPECILLKDLTNSCGCPTKVPTVTVNFPCKTSGGCDIGCATDYVIASPTASCTASTKKHT